MLRKRVGVAVQSDGRILVPEDLGERFYIHATLNGTSGEGMPEGMKTFMRDIRLFQKQLEAALIGADGNGLPLRGHH